MRLKALTVLLKKKILIVSAGCLAVFFVMGGILYTLNKEEPRKTPEKVMGDQVDLQVMNVHYTEATEEGVIWEVHAESAQYRKKDNLALLKNPKITLTMPDGRIYVLTGKEGTLKQDSKDMKLTGDVHLQSNNGNSFKTDEVTYSGREKRCHTGSPVSLKNSRMQIDATGMSISLADEHLTLLSGVKACIQR